MDEFYGGYNYTSNCDGSVVSAADNIIDVDQDDVLIIDGLTKRFRLPGWVSSSKVSNASHSNLGNEFFTAGRLDRGTQGVR